MAPFADAGIQQIAPKEIGDRSPDQGFPIDPQIHGDRILRVMLCGPSFDLSIPITVDMAMTSPSGIKQVADSPENFGSSQQVILSPVRRIAHQSLWP
ncbi:hypothetical protein ACRDNQ_10485 [Palleronia sp. KMU-117]|uniref:hypothetical protein n=1 Tax=Palleronia sp. KMU-117 TaxID=3434108 RepID=UPI003D70B3E0